MAAIGSGSGVATTHPFALSAQGRLQSGTLYAMAMSGLDVGVIILVNAFIEICYFRLSGNYKMTRCKLEDDWFVFFKGGGSMRSAFVFLDYSQEEIIKFLNSNFESFDNVQWIVRKDNDPVLYIEFDEERMLLNDLEEGETNELKERFMTFPPQVLTIDISGRHHGENELLSFLKVFLYRFEALVKDDYTEHLWTSYEIFNGSLFRNHKFFDFTGWYNEKHK